MCLKVLSLALSVQFIAYTEDVTSGEYDRLFDKHNLGYHLFADDKQLYTHILPGHEVVSLHKLASCISELQEWCSSHRLQLNAAKTELIWFGSRAALQKSSADRSLTVDSVVIRPTDVFRNLGVLLDSEVTMKPHINLSTCFYHFRRLRQLKRHVNRDVMKQLVSEPSFRAVLTIAILFWLVCRGQPLLRCNV